MINKICRETRREIDESELHQALSDSVLIHLQSCTACQVFRNERTRLRDLVGSLEPVTAPADFDFRLRARLAAQRKPSGQRLFSALGFTAPATIAAAFLVMLVGSIVWLNQRTPAPVPTTAKSQEPSRPENKPTSESKASDQGTRPADVMASTSTSNRRTRGISSAKTRTASSDFNESAATSIRGADDAGAVSLAAPVKPLVVSMEDDRGATRTISLPPVSFGSQRLVDNRIPQGPNSSRVW